MTPLTTLIDADTLVAKISDPQWAVFDCRFDLGNTEAGWKQYRRAHIPGAIYAHIDHHLSSPITPLTGRHPLPNVSKLVRWLGQCGIDQGTQVVVYDDTGGNMAVRLWWLLHWLGHQAVAVLDGGWPAWQALGLPATDAVGTRTPTRFAGEPDGSQILTTDDVLKNLDTKRWRLIDPRTAIRFRGEQEPIDPVFLSFPFNRLHQYVTVTGTTLPLPAEPLLKRRVLCVDLADTDVGTHEYETPQALDRNGRICSPGNRRCSDSKGDHAPTDRRSVLSH